MSTRNIVLLRFIYGFYIRYLYLDTSAIGSYEYLWNLRTGETPKQIHPGIEENEATKDSLRQIDQTPRRFHIDKGAIFYLS